MAQNFTERADECGHRDGIADLGTAFTNQINAMAADICTSQIYQLTATAVRESTRVFLSEANLVDVAFRRRLRHCKRLKAGWTVARLLLRP